MCFIKVLPGSSRCSLCYKARHSGLLNLDLPIPVLPEFLVPVFSVALFINGFSPDMVVTSLQADVIAAAPKIIERLFITTTIFSNVSFAFFGNV